MVAPMPPPVTYRSGHTSQIEPQLLARVRSTLELVFAGDYGDQDWEHCIGGMHVIAFHGEDPVGHASVIQRRIVNGGRALRCGYVEGVAVHPDWRRKGIGGQMMAELEAVIRGAYDLGALGATDDAAQMYAGRGWLKWRGPLSALTPGGTVATPQEAGCIFVLPAAVTPDLDSALTCDWRDGDVW